MDNVIQRTKNRLTIGEMFFSIPISIAAIILSIIEFQDIGINVYSVFPLVVGLQNVLLLIYRKSNLYRTQAIKLSVVVFICAALLIIIN